MEKIPRVFFFNTTVGGLPMYSIGEKNNNNVGCGLPKVYLLLDWIALWSLPLSLNVLSVCVIVWETWRSRTSGIRTHTISSCSVEAVGMTWQFSPSFCFLAWCPVPDDLWAMPGVVLMGEEWAGSNWRPEETTTDVCWKEHLVLWRLQSMSFCLNLMGSLVLAYGLTLEMHAYNSIYGHVL